MIQQLGPTAVKRWAVEFQIEAADREALLRRLGSKYGVGPVSHPKKDAWMRGALGRDLTRREVSGDAREVLRRWLLGAWSDVDAVEGMLRAAFGGSN